MNANEHELLAAEGTQRMETADETDNAEERHEWAGIVNRKERIEKRGPADNPKLKGPGGELPSQVQALCALRPLW